MSSLSQTAPPTVLPILAPSAVVSSGVVRPKNFATVHPAGQFNAVDDIAPLVRSAHLERHAHFLGKMAEIVSLQDHVVEFEEGHRLLALKPKLDRIERQHPVDW